MRGLHRPIMCVGTHPGAQLEVESGAGFRQSAGRPPPSGKGIPYTCTGREVTADAACTVGKHPLPISPSRDWFALFRLCKVGPAFSFS